MVVLDPSLLIAFKVTRFQLHFLKSQNVRYLQLRITFRSLSTEILSWQPCKLCTYEQRWPYNVSHNVKAGERLRYSSKFYTIT